MVAPYAPQPDLVGPVVQGNVLQVGGMGWPLLFSGPSDPNSWTRMAVRVSEDGGKKWEQRYLVSEHRVACSDMVQLPGQVVGLLYETGVNDTYETTRFERISLEEVLR